MAKASTGIVRTARLARSGSVLSASGPVASHRDYRCPNGADFRIPHFNPHWLRPGCDSPIKPTQSQHDKNRIVPSSWVRLVFRVNLTVPMD